MAVSVVIVMLIYTMAAPHMYSRFWILPPLLALSTIYARPSLIGIPIAAVRTVPGGD